ncbi:Hypothetical protein FKW44_003782 [Caligus rogercresseyi]|uniref:Uncharacterized protein n=1 Tax=Caligus rogercresseyi TaxID=217165 RepID=A0A7T8QXD0_CALRO|nr:Hypothetical protein FKW44_003782 [Caligus rogercresseyi]
MGLRVPPNTRGLFWGHKSTANGPQVPPQTIGVFWVTNTPPMGHQDPPNTTGLFWSYKSPANGPSGSAKRNRAVSHKKCLITYRQ